MPDPEDFHRRNRDIVSRLLSPEQHPTGFMALDIALNKGYEVGKPVQLFAGPEPGTYRDSFTYLDNGVECTQGITLGGKSTLGMQMYVELRNAGLVVRHPACVMLADMECASGDDDVHVVLNGDTNRYELLTDAQVQRKLMGGERKSAHHEPLRSKAEKAALRKKFRQRLKGLGRP